MTEQALNVRLVGQTIRPENVLAIVKHDDTEYRVRFKEGEAHQYWCDGCGSQSNARCPHARAAAAMIRLHRINETPWVEPPKAARNNRLRGDHIIVKEATLADGTAGVVFRSRNVAIPLTADQAIRVATMLADQATEAMQKNGVNPECQTKP